MTGIKPSSHGIVVEHNESGVRYAVSDRNYNPKVHKKIRDLRPGETVLGYQPKRKGAIEGSEGGSEAVSGTGTQDADANASSSSSEPVDRTAGSTQTEGSAPADAKGK
ncbi:hypothetical protein SEA_NEFERTHENA_14 [Microbacterium phage Neferthena]|uniref:Uncharacterized protein n=1 Tax=Microbacterium phage Neferthena TaxID=2301539 RepID=A0A385D3C6_9CAUD|nr:hypothetical protein HOT92_gp14 [Microbacterium phage Neferthena]AXQ52878.1 hypothetical protein SEA_NEFERTHENA_14 [Microbacterium phage Neferthena]